MAGTGKSLVTSKAEELPFGLTHGSRGLETKLAQKTRRLASSIGISITPTVNDSAAVRHNNRNTLSNIDYYEPIPLRILKANA